MIRILCVVALGVAVASSARADAVLVPLDGKDARPADFGYTIHVVPGPNRVDVSLDLTPAAARAFGTGDLTLTRGQQTVVAAKVALQKDGRGNGTLKLTFDPAAIDGGELIIWSAPIEGQPLLIDFGGFRLSIVALLHRAREPEPATRVLMRTMDGFRKKLPEPHGLGEMNGLGVPDIDGTVHPDSHLRGIAIRLGVKTRAECLVLLTYLKDRDPKMRRIAAFALESVLNASPNGMSSSDMEDVGSAGHRKMVQAFIAGIEKLPH